MRTLKTLKKKVQEVRNMQKKLVEVSNDEYIVGVYNGLELAVSILEVRTPEYLTIVREPQIIEDEEQELGRTIYSGVRKR